MNLTIEKPSVTHREFVIVRSYPVSPERVFAALSEPSKKRRWFGENENHELVAFEMDFRVGGIERASYRLNKGGPMEGSVVTSYAVYLDIVPNKRVVSGSTMSMGEHCISATLGTFELQQQDGGTKLIFTHQGAFFEGADGPEMRENGWRLLLDKLEKELTRGSR